MWWTWAECRYPGREIVFEGTVEQLCQDSTLTGQYMKRFMPMKEQFRYRGQMRIANANHHNLNNVTVDIPEGVLTVVTGVAGQARAR